MHSLVDDGHVHIRSSNFVIKNVFILDEEIHPTSFVSYYIM